MKKFFTFIFVSFLGFSLFAQTGVKFEFQQKIQSAIVQDEI